MNYKLMLRTLGRTLQLEALCLLPPLVTALLYHEDPRPFVYTIVLVALLGTALSCLKAKPEFYSREGYAVVGLIWLTLSLFGALPFFFSGYFPSYIDSFFEVVSGFTTTGCSILTAVEGLPRGILFWRSFSSSQRQRSSHRSACLVRGSSSWGSSSSTVGFSCATLSRYSRISSRPICSSRRLCSCRMDSCCSCLSSSSTVLPSPISLHGIFLLL